VRRAAVLVVLALLSLEPSSPAGASDNGVRATVMSRRRPTFAAEPASSAREAPPRRTRRSRPDDNAQGRTAKVQNSAGTADAPTFDVNVNGARFTGVVPPDPAGEAGTTQYVHTVNTSHGAHVIVFDKTTHAFTRFRMSTLAGPGSACENGLGDGVPYFDQLTNRWFLTELAAQDNALCVYISADDDATGTYTGYEVGPFPQFPDYPKWAIWADAVYLGYNDSGFSAPVYAFNKSKMLLGNNLSGNDIVSGEVSPLGGFGFQMLMPVDMEGPTPLAGPGVFVRHVDDEVHSPGTADPLNDQIEYVEVDPAGFVGAGTVSAPTSVDVAEFDSRLCGLFSLACIPQHGTRRRLDPLREVIMNRPVLRVGTAASTDQVLVGSFAVDVGSDRAGVRWFELSRPAATTSGGWALEDEGMYAPAGLHRWIPSVATNDDGDIALGYSASSGRVYPSIRITGRHPADPPDR
jgi:hypothetical protein